MAVAVTTTFTKEERMKYIGGSDIAKVMGLSRWGTPLKLWAEKTGKLDPPDLSDVEAVEMGNDLEEFVAQKFSQKTGKAVRRAPKEYYHKDYAFMTAHLDRLVTGSDELLECKTCSLWKKDEWANDDIPQEYILQVMWYLGITGRKVGHIAVLIGGQSFKYKQIDFNQELFDTMIEQAIEFWEHVKNDTPPAIMPEDDETLKEMFSTHSDEMIEMYDDGTEKTKEALVDFETAVANLQETKAHISDLESEKKAIETNIKNLIQDSLGIKTPKYKITWKEQAKTNVNTQALKDDGVYEKYSTKSSYRVLRITNNKESEVA